MVGPTIITNPPAFYGNGPRDLQAFADSLVDASNTYLLRLGDAAASLTPPVIEPAFSPSPTAPALVTATPPVMTDVVWTAPAIPDAFTASLDVADLTVDAFTLAPPDLVIPDAPTFDDTAPLAPAVDSSFVMPELTVTLPARPDLLSLNIVPFDGLNMPVFDATAPELTVASPSIREYTPGAQYTSALLTGLQATLLDRIQNGGTGLGLSGETAIWERGREREFRSAAEAIAELDQMETLGYALPPGGFVDARLKIITETDYASRGHSREVMAKSAELELENVKNALAQATQLEGQTMDYSNKVEQRLFDSCKYATEAGVQIYNAEVQAFGQRIEVYKSKAQVFEALVRAEVSRVEAYKAQVDAEMAKAQINRVLVDQYKAEIDAALSNIDIFKAQIAGIQARSELERSKIMIYGEEVKAFASRVSAFSAGVEGFRARIGAETSKQEAFGARVRAYSAQVEAQTKQIESRIAVFRGNLESYTAQWDGFKSAYQGEAAKAQAIAAYNSSRSEAYRAQVQGIASYNELLTKQWNVTLEQSARTAEIGVSAAKANAELYMTTRSLALDSAKVGAQVSAQLGAAALSTLHWSASYSESRGDNNSTSYSESTSTSTSTAHSDSTSNSTSVATNYNYNV